MRFLEHARARARDYRVAYCSNPTVTGSDQEIKLNPGLGAEHLWSAGTAALDPPALFARVLASLDAAEIDVEPDRAGLLQGAQATLSMSEGVLLYNPSLDEPENRPERLLVFAHELGHVAQHQDLADRVESAQTLLEPAAWGNSVAGVARYSRKAAVEAEANAFAAELLCPADAVFDLWRQNTRWTSESLAQALGLPVVLIRVQLAEGLRRFVHGHTQPAPDPVKPSRSRRPNPRQHDAVRSVDRPTLINAGPGTGKTATLAEHVGFLLGPNGSEGTALADPREILVLTFSNEAADELRERIEQVFSREIAERITIATFHGFGYQLLLHYGQRVGLKGELHILDTPAQEELLLRVLGRSPCPGLVTLRDPRQTAEQVRQHLSHLKNELRTPEDLESEIQMWDPADEEEDARRQLATELLGLYRAYEAAKRESPERTAVDFGDLILLPYQILRDHPEVRQEVQIRHRWILVDEYQDTGRGVAPFLQLLTGPDNRSWVVGDPRQSIHRFRGAAPENVLNFARDFAHAGKAVEIPLEINYRSARGIVRVANQLATLMEYPEHSGSEFKEYWRADEENPADLQPSITVAVANCDAAERHHIVQRVRRWITDESIPPRDIAVLARTNRDVRLLGLLLREANIPVAAGGIVTAEGAGGDLAAVALVPDSTRVALPRLAFALGRSSSLAPDTINGAIRVLLGTDSAQDQADREVLTLADEVRRIVRLLGGHDRFADPWHLLAVFLFDASSYLRRYLEDRSPEAELALDEVITALSLAAGHRFAQRGAKADESRMLFAEHYRRTLIKPTETVDSERTYRDAVRVMTCHAAKGLQFPHVVVAGQWGRPPRRAAPAKRPKPRYAWLPPTVQPDPAGEEEQEASLLFVAVTRAEQRVVVGYASTANDRPRSPKRPPAALLGRWLEHFATEEPEIWTLPSNDSEAAPIVQLWGVASQRNIPVRHLTDDGCAIQVYLEVMLGLRIKTVPDPLYPEFMGRVRSALRQVVETAIGTGEAVTQEGAEAIFNAAWPEGEHEGHPHLEIYRPLGRKAVLGFASQYMPGDEVLLDTEPSVLDGSVQLGLVAVSEAPSGALTAIGLQANSLVDLSKDGSTIPWGELKGAKRLPFALLAGQRPDLRARVYSAHDKQLYDYAINTSYLKGTLEKTAARHQSLRTAGGVQPIQERNCERCTLRVTCPYWLELLRDPGSTAA